MMNLEQIFTQGQLIWALLVIIAILSFLAFDEKHSPLYRDKHKK